MCRKEMFRLFGRTICVVNRSEVVGRPLAALLANDGACVYSVDVTGVQQFTRGEGIRKRKHEIVEKEGWTVENCAPMCDVVITGVPGNKYKFPLHLVKDGAVCINFSSEKVESCPHPGSLADHHRILLPRSRRELRYTCQPLAKSPSQFFCGISCASYRTGRRSVQSRSPRRMENLDSASQSHRCLVLDSRGYLSSWRL